jgi:spore germination protein GerM
VRRRPFVGAAVAAVAVAVALGGCGVSTQDEATITSPDDVPFGLADDTPGQPPSVLTAEGPFARVYLVEPNGEQLISSTRQVEDGRVGGVLAALLSGPSPSEADLGVTTALPDDEIVRDVEANDGVATVDLAEGFADIDGEAQRVALAQIVYTLTGRTGISRVVFTLDDRPVEVPRGDGTLSTGSLTRDDYADLEPAA